MKYILPFLLVGCCSLQIVAEPLPSYKEGWNLQAIDEFAAMCTKEIISSAKQSYYVAAKEAGNQNPKLFPETVMTESVDAMCACVVESAAQQWSLFDLSQNASDYFSLLLSDVLAGKRCKPTGILDKAINALKHYKK